MNQIISHADWCSFSAPGFQPVRGGKGWLLGMRISRNFRSALLVVAFLVVLMGVVRAADRAPNIVLIYADDLGFGDLGCYGGTAVPTPNVDRLASGGLRFTDGHSAAATCTPSRYSLLTGQYAWRKKGRGILAGDANLIIEPGTVTLPSILREAGYRTGIVGKWHLGLGKGEIDWNEEIPAGPIDVGFDTQFILPATQDRVPCVFVEGRKVVNLDPKDPLRVNYFQNIGRGPTGVSHPKELVMAADPQHSGSIVNGVSRIGFMSGGRSAVWSDEDMADVLAGQAVRFIEKNRAKPFFLYFPLLEPHVPRIPHPRFVGKTALGRRGDVIVQMDWIVGQVLDTLDRLGIAENTVVIFSSDNGPVLNDGYTDGAVSKNGDHKPSGPFRGGKYDAFEGGTRVPFIVRWPGRVKPGVSDALMCQIDFPASIARLTNQTLGPGEAPDSQNMLEPLLGNSPHGRKTLVEEGMIATGLRVGEWKLVQANDPKKTSAPKAIPVTRSLLFDLSSDPGETRDLSEADPGRLGTMEKKLRDLRQGGGE